MPGGEVLTARDLDYDLPESLIAQQPAVERDASRLLWLERGAGVRGHHHVRELPELVRPALWVLNDTRVVPSRLFGTKPTGGRVELLLVERLDAEGQDAVRLDAEGQDAERLDAERQDAVRLDAERQDAVRLDADDGATQRQRWVAMGRASKGLGPGARVRIEGEVLEARVTSRREDGMLELELEASGGVPVDEAIAAAGHVPLPPYIRRADVREDRERYQTVYAAHDGAIAAPTAGLHLTRALLDRLVAAGHELATLTLHVGPGTFAPLKHEALGEHVMHAERFAIPDATAQAIARARARGVPVLAVGTTVVRALEAAARADRTVTPGEGRTSLFIRPPQALRVVDALLTNFHLPRSTLLALVMAFGGVDSIREAYRVAVQERYRFYSYGDAMLIGGDAT